MLQPGDKVRTLCKVYDRMVPRLYSVAKGSMGEVLQVSPYVTDGYVTGIQVALVVFRLEVGLAFCQVNVRALEEVVC